MQLNFKDYNFTIKKNNGNTLIFDIVRKKSVILTPEEWVRQHVVHYLINELGYPLGLIAVEKSMLINSQIKRFDVVVHNKNGQALILVECKAPNVKINGKTLDQASNYQQYLKCEYAMLTNGISHYFLNYQFDQGLSKQIQQLPLYSETLQ